MKMQPFTTYLRYKSMNQRSISTHKLEQLAVPTVKFDAHQAQLKQALVAASRSKQTTNINEVWSYIMNKRKFVLSGAAMTLAIVGVLAFSLFSGPSQAAYAEQLTNQGLQRVDKLSTDEKQDLNARLNGNAEDELKAAKEAKDLQVLTYAEFQKLSPQVSNIRVHGPNNTPGPDSLNPAKLKYLKYTTADGFTHIIGVGADGLPAMIMAFRNSGGTQEGTTQMMDRNDDGAGTVEIQGSTGPESHGQPNGAGCVTSSGGEVHCTTSGGGSPTCQTEANGATSCSSTASPSTENDN